MLQLSASRPRVPALLLWAALGAALAAPQHAHAGSCCGGSAGPSLLVPKLFQGRAEVSFDWERYDGFWNEEGEMTPDPPGSDLNQYRVNVAYAHRFTPTWQAYVGVPYVWNDNRYSAGDSDSDGLGDSTLGAWWEAYGGWLYLGPALLVPTGVSPYDDVDTSFDVTGRGFYRLDGNLMVEKTFSAWDLFLLLTYGWYFERDVNQEYGKDVEPYEKQLGPRFQGTASLSYTWTTSLGLWTGTAGFSYLQEEDGTVDGEHDPTSGFRKTSVLGAAAYSTADRVWSIRAAWNHAVDEDDWGENFPATDTYTLGVSYAFR